MAGDRGRDRANAQGCAVEAGTQEALIVQQAGERLAVVGIVGGSHGGVEEHILRAGPGGKRQIDAVDGIQSLIVFGSEPGGADLQLLVGHHGLLGAGLGHVDGLELLGGVFTTLPAHVPVSKAGGQEILGVDHLSGGVGAGAGVVLQQPCLAVVALVAVGAVSGDVGHDSGLIQNVQVPDNAHEGAHRLGQGEGHGVVVVSGAGGDIGEQIGKALADGLEAVEGEHHVGCLHLVAAVELHALLQVEGVGQAVLTDRPVGSQVGHLLAAVLQDKAVIQVLYADAAHQIVDDRRVDLGGAVGGKTHDAGTGTALAVRGCIVGFGAAAASQQAEAEHQRQDHCKGPFHNVPPCVCVCFYFHAILLLWMAVYT